jgi:hypothetical protein
MLDYIETKETLEANCQFPVALVSEPIGDRRRVTRFDTLKGQLCRYGYMGEKS